MPVAGIYTGGVNPDEDLVVFGAGFGNVSELENIGGAAGRAYDRIHEPSSSSASESLLFESPRAAFLFFLIR